MGIALTAGALAVQSPGAAAEPAAAASAEAPQPNAAVDAQRDAERQKLRLEALSHLAGAPRAKFEQMSDDEVGALMNATAPDQLSDEEKKIRTALANVVLERQLQYQTGDIELGEGLATLHLGNDFRYLGPADAEKLLVEGWGNPPGTNSLGMIVPAKQSPLHQDTGWAVVVTYNDDGHVEDDDAADIDFDDLLKDMQKDTLASNEARKSQGYETVELIGWAAPPRYDGATHRLYWAKELKFDGGTENTLNYAIRVLGRKGVLELNAVGSISQLSLIRAEMEKVLPRAEFESGSRYSDFDPDVDQVAAYGIGGLIAGKVLAKAGLFAGLLKVLIASKKLVIIAVLALGGLAAKLFKGRSRTGDGEQA